VTQQNTVSIESPLNDDGQGKQRHYMKMDCYDYVPADQNPPVDIEILEKEIPENDWRKGHSGEMLNDTQSAKLEEVWADYFERTHAISSEEVER